MTDTGWLREPGRIAVGNSEDGWRLWEALTCRLTKMMITRCLNEPDLVS